MPYIYFLKVHPFFCKCLYCPHGNCLARSLIVFHWVKWSNDWVSVENAVCKRRLCLYQSIPVSWPYHVYHLEILEPAIIDVFSFIWQLCVWCESELYNRGTLNSLHDWLQIRAEFTKYPPPFLGRTLNIEIRAVPKTGMLEQFLTEITHSNKYGLMEESRTVIWNSQSYVEWMNQWVQIQL